MQIRHFRIAVVLRVLLLAATLMAFTWVIFQQEYLTTTLILAGIAVILVINLIRYVERTNEQITRFLESIRYSDFSVHFREPGIGRSFRELHQAFTNVIEEFRRERTERQESYRTMQTVVQHVGIGLLAFNQKGEVTLLNTAAKRMLNRSYLRQISELSSFNTTLLEALMHLKGGHRTLIRFRKNNQQMQWAVYATEFVIRGDTFKLVSIQNISRELEEKEMEAWEKLTQVLAHEIMNSITPISSLSDTVHNLVNHKISSDTGINTLDDETLQDVRDALTTISNRSRGLLRFVQSYRDFTQIPNPDPKRIRISELFSSITHLMKGEFEKLNVRVDIRIDPETLEVDADPQLMEQVLINLTKNALRAMRDTSEPRLIYRAALDTNGHIRIDVADNGPGIKKELQESIFIPFYTTSGADQNRGTGIGLSLSRQIMRMHKGTLTVSSEPGKETVFSLIF